MPYIIIYIILLLALLGFLRVWTQDELIAK